MTGHVCECRPHQVRLLHGISALMQLLSSDNLEIQQYAAGATRNLIYENAENKVALIDAGGLTRLVESLDQPDEELRKTITGQRRALVPHVHSSSNMMLFVKVRLVSSLQASCGICRPGTT